MKKDSYPFLSKLLHDFYLGNYFISETSYEIEKKIFRNAINSFELNEQVFITGLARAGTTALFNKLYETSEFSSLKYSNMPFLLMPNLWKKFNGNQKSELVERAHHDGIKIGLESPEEFDEYFWKATLKDNYIKKDGLILNKINPKNLDSYLKYVKLVCNSFHKKNYLSKNNNNILRLSSLKRIFPDSKIIVLYRFPLDHALSLLKQHNNFISLQKADAFALKYFNYLGHHEFGLNHKPFILSDSDLNDLNMFKPSDLNYWLIIWKNYYKYLMNEYGRQVILISHEDLCEQPSLVADFLNSNIKIPTSIKIDTKFKPGQHAEQDFHKSILKECILLHEEMNTKREYTH